MPGFPYNLALMDHWFGIGDYDAVNLRYTDRSPSGLHAGWTAGGTAPTKDANRHGVSLDGSDLLTGATQGKFNQSRIAIALMFAPTFAHDDGASHHLIDTTNAARYAIEKTAGNALDVYLGNTSVLSIAAATYGPFWKVNQYNTMVVTGTTGDNQAILNRNSVGTSATAWAAANPVNFWFGCRYDSTLFFAGRFHNIAVYPIRMTMLQAGEWEPSMLRRVNDV